MGDKPTVGRPVVFVAAEYGINTCIRSDDGTARNPIHLQYTREWNPTRTWIIEPSGEQSGAYQVKNLVEMDAGILFLGAPRGEFRPGASATGENRPYPVKISYVGDGCWAIQPYNNDKLYLSYSSQPNPGTPQVRWVEDKAEGQTHKWRINPE